MNELIEVLGHVDGERGAAYRALCDYALMGGGGADGGRRSLPALAARYLDDEHPPTRHQRTLEKWSRRFRWQERVQAFDLAIEAARVQKWAARRLEVDELDWEDGQRMRRLARLALAIDLDTSEGITPAVARLMLKDASTLQRLSTGAPTANVKADLPPEFVKLLDRAYPDGDADDNPAD